MKKAFDHVDRNQGLQAMREHGGDKQHLAWISKQWVQHSSQMRLGHFESRKPKRIRAPTWSASEPHGVHTFTSLVGTVPPALSKNWLTKGKEYGFRLDEWYGPTVAYADGIVVLATSQKTFEHMMFALTEGFRERGLEIGHAKTNWSSTHKLRDPGLQSGGRKRGMDKKMTYVGMCVTLNGSSAPSGHHRMKQSQRTYTPNENSVLTVSDSQPKDGSIGRSSLAKHDVESTGMAPYRKHGKNNRRHGELKSSQTLQD